MFLAKNRGPGETQSKPQEAAVSTSTSASASAAAAALQPRDSIAPALESTLAATIAPSSKLQPGASVAHALEPAPAITIALSPTPTDPGPHSFPSPVRTSHASIFSSPLTCPSPAASAAGDTALLSAQVVDLRRRLAECERDKDISSHQHAISLREASEAAAAVRLELQSVREQAFEESEALRFQHQQEVDSLGAETLRLQHITKLSEAARADAEQRLHLIEGKLADAMSSLEAAQEKLLGQAAVCSGAQAHQEELQVIVEGQAQEISAWDSRHRSLLIAFQQLECSLQDTVAAQDNAHQAEAHDLRSQITKLSAELESSNSLLSKLKLDHEASQSQCSGTNSSEAEVTKLRSLLQESSDRAAISICKLQSECSRKEQELAVALHELAASHAAVAEANHKESNLNLQVQSLQLQLVQRNKDIQEQKAVHLSTPTPASPGDSTALEVSTRRIAEIERKCESFLVSLVFARFSSSFFQICGTRSCSRHSRG